MLQHHSPYVLSRIIWLGWCRWFKPSNALVQYSHSAILRATWEEHLVKYVSVTETSETSLSDTYRVYMAKPKVTRRHCLEFARRPQHRTRRSKSERSSLFAWVNLFFLWRAMTRLTSYSSIRRSFKVNETKNSSPALNHEWVPGFKNPISKVAWEASPGSTP